MAEKPKTIKDRVGEVYGNWKVIEFHSMSDKPDPNGCRSCWIAEHLETGECCIKTARQLANSRYYKKHIEKIYQSQRKWVAEHRTQWNTMMLERYYKNRQHRKAVMKAYYEKNKEHWRAYGREYMRNRDKAKIKESIEKLKARRDNNEVLVGQTNKIPLTYLGRIFNARYKYEKPDAPVSQWCDPEYRKAAYRAYKQTGKYQVTPKSVTVVDRIKNWLKKK